MTARQVARARKKISRPNYYKKRLRTMEQCEAWWTEQVYMYGLPGHHTVLYDPNTAAKQTRIYGNRIEYYARKISKEAMLSLDWRDLRRIVLLADDLVQEELANKMHFKTEYLYYRELQNRLKQIS